MPEAAARELWEETGITVPADALGESFFQGRHTYRRNGIDVHVLRSSNA